jgi:hypothetical protein
VLPCRLLDYLGRDFISIKLSRSLLNWLLSILVLTVLQFIKLCTAIDRFMLTWSVKIRVVLIKIIALFLRFVVREICWLVFRNHCFPLFYCLQDAARGVHEKNFSFLYLGEIWFNSLPRYNVRVALLFHRLWVIFNIYWTLLLLFTHYLVRLMLKNKCKVNNTSENVYNYS